MKTKKDVYYFSHDANARNDEKILQMRAEYGWEGYGLYWGIVEILRESTDNKFSMQNIKALKLGLNLNDFPLEIFLEKCISEFNLFTLHSGKFYSNRLISTVKKYKQISCIKSGNAKGKKKTPPADPPETKTNPELFKQLFEGVWKDYPNKDGRKAAEKHFYASVKSEKDYYDFTTAMNNYLETDKVKKGFIKNGSTFFNNWRDYIVLNGIHKPKNELEPEKF